MHNIPSASMSQSKAEGKLPVEVTIIDEQGKRVTKHNEPGILSKGPFEGMSHISPTHTLPFKKTESIVGNSMMGSLNAFSRRPKIELPNFDGVNPRGWVKKCQKYFTIFAVNDHQKLEIAAMYLTSKAEVWFDGYIMQKPRVSWNEFVNDLCQRFSDRTYADTIEEFNKLSQKGTLDEYQEKFEELKPYMLQFNSNLPESYFISSFVSGLKEELKLRVKAYEPNTLAAAYRQARLHELSLELEHKKQKPNFRPNLNPNLKSTYHAPHQTARMTTSNSLIEQRRAQNLCFKCGDKFIPGHVCKNKQLNSITVADNEEETT